MIVICVHICIAAYIFALTFAYLCCLDSVSFRLKNHNFYEDEPRIFLRLDLEEPAESDLIVQVSTNDITATGELIFFYLRSCV